MEICYHQPEPHTALEQAQRQQISGKLLSAMPLPVAKAAKLLFGAGRAKITGLAFVDAVTGIVRIERAREREAAIIGEWAGLAT